MNCSFCRKMFRNPLSASNFYTSEYTEVNYPWSSSNLLLSSLAMIFATSVALAVFPCDMVYLLYLETSLMMFGELKFPYFSISASLASNSQFISTCFPPQNYCFLFWFYCYLGVPGLLVFTIGGISPFDSRSNTVSSRKSLSWSMKSFVVVADVVNKELSILD